MAIADELGEAPVEEAPKVETPADRIVFDDDNDKYLEAPDDDFLELGDEDEGDEGQGDGSDPAPDGDAPSPEQTARDMGWRPESEWSGDKAGWVSAEVFLEKAERRERFRMEKSTKWKAEQDAKLDKLNSVIQNQAKRESEAKIEGVRNQMRAALQKGDMQALYDLARAEKDLEAEAKAPVEKGPDPAQHAQRMQGMAQQFNTRNALILDESPEWSDRARAIANEIENEMGDEADPAFVLYETEIQLRREYKAGAPGATKNTSTQRKVPHVERRANPVGGNAAGKTDNFDTLPSDAKAGFQQLVRMGLYKDSAAGRKEYLADYKD
jgi:hypothetical protein